MDPLEPFFISRKIYFQEDASIRVFSKGLTECLKYTNDFNKLFKLITDSDKEI
jgi:hypothetical protein